MILLWYNIIILRLLLLQPLLIGYGKKNQQSSFPVTGYRIPFRTTNSYRRSILIALGGGRRTRTRAPRSVRPSGSDRLIIYMRRRRHRCRSPEGHLPRGKNAFSSRPWLSLSSFYIIHSLSFQLSTQNIM